MYKVMVIDDEEIVRMGIRDLIDWEKEGFYICGEGRDGRDGLEKLLRKMLLPLIPREELTDQMEENGIDTADGILCASIIYDKELLPGNENHVFFRKGGSTSWKQ